MDNIYKLLTTLPGSWNKYLSDEIKKEYFIKLANFLCNEYKTKNIFPPYSEVYNALKYVSLEEIKIVIFGQDPYYKINQANGLAFSLNKGVKITPSLRNIFKEISNEYGYEIPSSGDLTSLARQGVLLLNTTLTVVENNPNSHKSIGWNNFVDSIINVIENNRKNVIYLLLGNDAKKKEELIRNKDNIVYAGHPSPLNTSKKNPFIGSNCFKEVNKKIKKYYNLEINFDLANL